MNIFIKTFLPIITIISLISCNELRLDKASKNGINLKNDPPAMTAAVNPAPDSLVAFLWPSQAYYEKYKDKGTIEAYSYQEFTKNVSSKVFGSGNDYDDWILTGLDEGPAIDSELNEIDEKLVPIKKRIKDLQAGIKVYKKEIKTIERINKKLNKDIKKRKKLAKTLSSEIASLKNRYNSECSLNMNSDVCKDLISLIAEKETKLSFDKNQTKKISDDVKKNKKDIGIIKKKHIASLFKEKKRIEKEEFNPLHEQKEPLLARLTEITTEQAEMIARVQEALDHHAVELELDEDGNTQYDDTGYLMRSVVTKKQVNWIQTYVNSAAENNSLKIKGNWAEIHFGEWGENHTSYKTLYVRDDEGNIKKDERTGLPMLSSDSDFFEISVSRVGLVKFKMKEKDARGNRTNKIYEFKLQQSGFGVHQKLLGDITVTLRGEVLRRGQLKVILTKDDSK